MTCQRPTSKQMNQQLVSINKLNEEKQLLEDMKSALNSSSNMNDFENRLKQLRTASLSRSATKQRFNRFAETMVRPTPQFATKSIIPPSNEHIYESIENNHFLNNSNKLSSDQDYYFNQQLNAYTQPNEANLIQTNDDDWTCSSYSTMNGVYDEKPLLLNRNLHSRQATELDYEDQLHAMHNIREKLRQSGHSFNVDQLSDNGQLPDLLLKFKNDFNDES